MPGKCLGSGPLFLSASPISLPRRGSSQSRRRSKPPATRSSSAATTTTWSDTQRCSKGQVYDKVPLRDGDTIASGERVEVVVTVETKNDYEYLLFEDLKPAGLEAVEIQSGQPLYAHELKSATVTRKFVDAKRPTTEPPSILQRNPNADTTGRTEWLYQELRDRKVAIFASQLPQGIWEIRYTLRAEVPGYFHALPLMASAMYVPEIRANSEEVRVGVK